MKVMIKGTQRPAFNKEIAHSFHTFVIDCINWQDIKKCNKERNRTRRVVSLDKSTYPP